MEKIISKDGTTIAYLKQGDGPPLVLVHGAGVVANNWVTVLPGLTKHFTVYAMERRGRGESGDNQPYAIEREVEDIAALVDSIGQPVGLLGHSFGANLALEAGLLTNNVHKLLLYEPPLNIPDFQIVPGGLIDPVSNLINDGKKEQALTHFYELIAIPATEIAQMQTLPDWDERVESAHLLRREIHVMENYFFDEAKYSNFPIETLFLIGEIDKDFWNDVLKKLDDTLLDFSSEMVPGQGHMAMMSAPDLFIDSVYRFFSE